MAGAGTVSRTLPVGERGNWHGNERNRDDGPGVFGGINPIAFRARIVAEKLGRAAEHNRLESQEKDERIAGLEKEIQALKEEKGKKRRRLIPDHGFTLRNIKEVEEFFAVERKGARDAAKSKVCTSTFSESIPTSLPMIPLHRR